VLAPDASAPLRPLIVWVPKSRGTESAVEYATSFVADARAAHFWDARGRVMDVFEQALGLTEDAWDVYILYGPNARWEDDLPPAPAFWMHQLGSREKPRVRGPWLDPQRLGTEIRRLRDAAWITRPGAARDQAAPR
jgi:hypothetical protein